MKTATERTAPQKRIRQTNQVKTYLNDKQLAKVVKAADKAGLTLAAYVRHRLKV